MTEKLKWGIMGTGAIANAFAQGLAGSKTGTLIAIGSRGTQSAETFGAKYNVPNRHNSYDALINDPEVQALYIATPHPMHAEWAIKAANAKKHLLVEKPIGINAAEAMAIIEAAHANDIFLMEAFMYRVHPQTLKLVELLRDKVIGEVRMIQAAFGFDAKGATETGRVLANDLGGGGILDVGCYPVSMSRLIAGAEPKEVKGSAHLDRTGVDEWAAATLRFKSGIVANIATAVQCNLENVCRIYGSEGMIFLPTPWVPSRNGGQSKIIVQRHGEKEPREITIDSPLQIYANEADYVAANLSKRQASFPGMTWNDTFNNMRVLDAWRASIGLTYDIEKPPRYPQRTLTVSSSSQMKYGSIPGVNKKLSRLVMGCDNQANFPHAAAMFDDFFQRGGNTFDTAWIYAGGAHERTLGQWITHRNVRDQVAIIAKGAHSPLCTPRDLTRQLHESLDRLQTDHADIYLMHRDNVDIPVGEFVDVLNEHHKAGRIRALGGSNWSLERVQQANDYAKANNKIGFAAVSNNFSLARLIEAPWPGCISAADSASRDWFTKTQIPLLSWSSQARGFFLEGKAAPGNLDDKELARCWYSEDNFERLRRVNEMAKKRNVLPINIALAYVLNQPFPTFALIGPRLLSETRTSFAALTIDLTAEEVRWLSLES